MQQQLVITSADIARLAGVGRAAVTNWRKRYDTFPRPVGGTAASPRFDLGQVEKWLSEHGRIGAVADDDRLWRKLLVEAREPTAALAAVGEHLRGARPLPYVSLRSDLDALAKRLGSRGAFVQMWRRFADPAVPRIGITPDALAELMVTLADVRGRMVLDPACGAGGLLRAAGDHGAGRLHGQEVDSAAANLAGLWLDINDLPGVVCSGDALRRDAFPGQAFDAVVMHPPFGLTNWGHEELGFDRRWEFGVPPRTEPELAWVQHALSHLTPDGRAVVLMPPSVASRRAGRRIRAELLRRGALRAIIALPPRAAAAHGVGLHLWILSRPATRPATVVSLVDATTLAAEHFAAAIVEAVRTGSAPARVIPVVDLLDENVDLTPGRHGLDVSTDANGAAEARASRKRLAALVDSLRELLPAPCEPVEPAGPLPVVAVSDLIRTGRLELLGPVRVGDATSEPVVDLPVLTRDDVLAGRPASGGAEIRPMPSVVLRPGDVVVPVLASRATALVVGETVVLGPGLQALRADPSQIDPWFLAGHLCTSANERRASGSSATLRFDVRRARVPRIPLDEQAPHAALFRRLHEFDATIRAAAALSEVFVRRTADGLASGWIRAEDGNL